jgi:hypothetical protein
MAATDEKGPTQPPNSTKKKGGSESKVEFEIPEEELNEVSGGQRDPPPPTIPPRLIR